MQEFGAFLDQRGLTLIAAVFFLALFLSRELGSWIFRRFASANEGLPEDASDKSYILSGVLGLLALLVAFTFSLSMNRYELRRNVVVVEANALGTAEMRVQLLPAPDGAELSEMLREYSRTRLAYGLATAIDKPALAAKSAVQRAQIQSTTVAAVRPVAQTPLGPFVGAAINSVLDVGAEREALNAAKVPGAILAALMGYNLLTAAMLGYALTGKRARQRPATAILFALLTLAFVMILDLDRPQGGTIKVDQTPMKQLVDGFASN